MRQRCHLAAIWLTWLGLPLLAVIVGLRAGIVGSVTILAIGIAAQWLYLRWFPHISPWLGYGSVVDTPASAVPPEVKLPHVTIYTANVCPFCPIVKRRLSELQRQRHFEVTEVDVTFRPRTIRAKGLRSVPVIEANGRVLVGNATSAEIAEFLKANAS